MTTPLRRAARRLLGARPTRVLAITGTGLVISAVLAAAGGGIASASLSGHPAKTVATKTTSRAATGALAARYSRLGLVPHAAVQLTEDGSSLLYPLYQAWAAGYAKSHPGFSSTSGADGSGTGIADAENGTTDFGASDAYLPPGTYTEYPTIENIPTAISAQMINYNVPGLNTRHLKLDGPVVAQMYEGKIRNWDNKAIKKLNPGVKLPNLKVVPVHRSDSSGDSFLFSSYLAYSDPSSFAGEQGPSTLPTFPSVPGELAAKGNSGMVAACASAKGCVAYIGVSYHKDIASDHLGMALLKNKAGNFELPFAKAIEAEAASFPKVPANGAVSLIFGTAKDGYPIINYEYIVLKTNQSSSLVASTMKAFLSWCINPKDGNSTSYLGKVGFKPLPSAAEQVATKLISKIH